MNNERKMTDEEFRREGRRFLEMLEQERKVKRCPCCGKRK